MQVSKQFSVFMVNKPGVLSRVLNEFAKAKINLIAMTVMDSAEHGVMRVVFSNADRARSILKRLNMPFNETDVLSVTLTNKSGALADIAEKLSVHHINISYAYCTAGARGGKTTGILKVADVKKAMRLLQRSTAKKPKKQASIRPSPSLRR